MGANVCWTCGQYLSILYYLHHRYYGNHSRLRVLHFHQSFTTLFHSLAPPSFLLPFTFHNCHLTHPSSVKYFPFLIPSLIFSFLCLSFVFPLFTFHQSHVPVEHASQLTWNMRCCVRISELRWATLRARVTTWLSSRWNRLWMFYEGNEGSQARKCGGIKGKKKLKKTGNCIYR